MAVLKRQLTQSLSMALAAFALASCAAKPGPVMNKATDKLISYFDAKQDLANTLQQRLGGPTQTSPRNEYFQYRLVAINGPTYPVGAVLAVGNSLDLITRRCVIETTAIPLEPWASMPRWTSSAVLDTDLGIPAPMRGVFDKTSLDAGLKLESASIYQIEEIGQRFLARDEMERFVASGECGDYLRTLREPVIFVRGIIYGKETLKSAKAFAAGVDLRVVEEESGQLRFKFDTSGAYELSDAAVVPKFAIMAKLQPRMSVINGDQVATTGSIGLLGMSQQGAANQAPSPKPDNQPIADLQPAPSTEEPGEGSVIGKAKRFDRPRQDRLSITSGPTVASRELSARFTVAPLSDEEVVQIEQAQRYDAPPGG